VIIWIDHLSKHSMKLQEWEHLKLVLFKMNSTQEVSSHLKKITAILKISIIIISVSLIQESKRFLPTPLDLDKDLKNQSHLRNKKCIVLQSRKMDLITFLFSENSVKLLSKKLVKKRKSRIGRNTNMILLFRKRKNILIFCKALLD